MTMTQDQIQQYVMTYLDATECQILEKSPYHVTVKLSPQADRDLTNRPYYWGFVERTGVEPETMSFSFVFDAEGYEALQERSDNTSSAKPGVGSGAPQLGSTQTAGQTQAPGAADDSVLGRYFGPIRPLPILGPGRIQKEVLTFGSPPLKQIFTAARQGGRCVYLFEDPGQRQRMTLFPASYEPWLGVCFKLEFCCDIKREEMHFIGISLLNGRIDELFSNRLAGIQLVPRLPENVSIEPSELSPAEGRDALEQRLRDKLSTYDMSWADAAAIRLREELELIDAYYQPLLNDSDEERKQEIAGQYEARRSEIRWQYEPRIVASVINYGIFHLRSPR
ncbi:hypothetical protein DMN77_15895 [Paenibacillus sp. 79R4]|uniref:YqhG family protein n=1 Tax=Paenibacillus sp. 79R4 TaxID=2212847 RepID=UPI0015BD14C6|nr:YqhG family protein [Paenibacillus sp. 79R4]NWL89041.1 hypothetical protein [Paenibacillus sp. 79R4]